MSRGRLLPLVLIGTVAAAASAAAQSDGEKPTGSAPRAVAAARATEMPECTIFVDTAASDNANGTAQQPYKTIAAAVAAARNGAAICVAEGSYTDEQLKPGEKSFTLAGGFQRGNDFKVRDSAAYPTKVVGRGGSFIRIEDPGPKGNQRTVIDGFDISGYSQAIFRDYYESQRFDITNNYIHDNTCDKAGLMGAGFSLNNVTGRIEGNVFTNNSCGMGGAGFVQDTKQENTVAIERNLVDSNHGTGAGSAHGGGMFVGGKMLRITGNLFTRNTVTDWGGGLYISAWTEGRQFTTVNLNWNVYRDNRAGNAGGGMFCDNGATCNSYHEVYDRNCGGNILLDGGTDPNGPNIARFDHLTNVGALGLECKGPAEGVRIDRVGGEPAADSYSFINAIFWGNAAGLDFAASCDRECDKVRVNVSHSMVQTKYLEQGLKVNFGEGIMEPVDPLFADPANGDFHLKSTFGRWTPTGYVKDTVMSPAIAKGFGGGSDNPPLAGDRNELGAYGNSIEASYTMAAAAPTPSPNPTPPSIPTPSPSPTSQGAGVPPTDPAKPAITRGGNYMGFPERFNRYYTDVSWQPGRTVYVSPNGGGDGATPGTPSSVQAAVATARPGSKIHFLRGNYQGCFGFSKQNSGSYDEPIVLYGERNEDKSLGVSLTCCNTGRQTCFNFEAADYIAVDGFELIGSRYGVRAVGAGYAASEHSRGIAVLNNKGHDQDRDPFFSGQSDWAVWERNIAYGAKAGDGHGIYISNGSDWNIVRFNETYSNVSSDFQINADPASTCKEVGIPFNDPRCDAYAGTGEGGQGASDYFLVDANYFHHGVGQGSGPNFTSVRRSIIRNNIFGFYNNRHNTSFWQETDNPKLGSSDNKIVHNLFITTNRLAVQFINNSTRNEFANNVIVGVRLEGGNVTGNPSALLMEVDGTVSANVYRSNLYIAGRIEGRTPNAEEKAQADFSAGWFVKFPATLNHDPNDFTPTGRAPFLGMGTPSPHAPTDRNGVARSGRVDLGPIEVP